jgi:hypothetical protein
MKNLIYLMLFVLPLTISSQEKEEISGQVMITCDLKTALMEEGGFNLIKSGKEGRFVVSYYGANKAKITVKNSEDKIVGIGKANEDGTFNISVKPDSFYILEISFLSFKVEEAISSDDAKNLSVFLGKVSGTNMMKVLGI